MKSTKDNDYQIVAMHTRLMCEQAPKKIEARWNDYDGLHSQYMPQNILHIMMYIHPAVMLTSTPLDRDPACAAAHPLIKDDYCLTLELGCKRNLHFTGRKDVLHTLHKMFINPSIGTNRPQATTVVLLGIGGVGKTQCARQYAYTHGSQYTSINWINATNLETTYASFHELARRLVRHYATRNKASIPPFIKLAQHLGIPGLIDGNGQISFIHETRKAVVEAVKEWYSSENNQGWLLIFDNVDDLESFDIGEFFPTAAANSSILITTRRRECTRFGEELELDVMQKLESIELLQRSCKRKHPFTGQGERRIII